MEDEDLLRKFEDLVKNFDERRAELDALAKQIIAQGGVLLVDTHQAKVDEISREIGRDVRVDPGPVPKEQRLTAEKAKEYRNAHRAVISMKADRILGYVKVAATLVKTAVTGVPLS